MQQDLLVRSASSFVLIAIAGFAIVLGGFTAGLVVAALAIIVYFEWAQVTRSPRISAIPTAIALGGAVLLVSVGMKLPGLAIAGLGILGAFMGGKWLAGGALYASLFGLGLLLILSAPIHGVAALVFVLAIAAATDTAAYVAGRTFGGPKLAPRLSPKKTWSGAIGGFLAAPIAGSIVAGLFSIPLTLGLIGTGAVLSVFSQAGDLFESWLKRRFRVKDSGSILPGHGGMMDRVDGLTFVVLGAIIIGSVRGGFGDIARGVLIW